MNSRTRVLTYTGLTLILIALLIDTPGSWVVWLVIAVAIATVGVDVTTHRKANR